MTAHATRGVLAALLVLSTAVPIVAAEDVAGVERTRLVGIWRACRYEGRTTPAKTTDGMMVIEPHGTYTRIVDAEGSPRVFEKGKWTMQGQTLALRPKSRTGPDGKQAGGYVPERLLFQFKEDRQAVLLDGTEVPARVPVLVPVSGEDHGYALVY